MLSLRSLVVARAPQVLESNDAGTGRGFVAVRSPPEAFIHRPKEDNSFVLSESCIKDGSVTSPKCQGMNTDVDSKLFVMLQLKHDQ